MWVARFLPKLDSGESRSNFGYPGNFTMEGMLYAAMVMTTKFPAAHTPISGLYDQGLVKSNVSGFYEFSQNPKKDRYGLGVSTLDNIRKVAGRMGSGVYPSALDRDYSAINSGNGAYAINWSAIQAEVVWITSEFGYGNEFYGAEQIKKSGNTKVSTHIVKDYGHGDMIFSSHLATDVWPLFVK
jgi:hypothetical protein